MLLLFKIFIFITLMTTCACPLQAMTVDQKPFTGYSAAFVLVDRSTGEVVDLDPKLSRRRLPPCSTFKIYNTLIGLELGLIKSADAPWYTWDGVTRSIEGWNKDLTLREAFKVSAVPAFQILARQITEARMKNFIKQLDYGTKDISAGIDVFWLDRPQKDAIAISAKEQVDLLGRLLDGKLPFSPQNVAVLKDIMTALKTEKGTLYGKTGSAFDEDRNGTIGWFVGFLESREGIHIFACNITDGKDPSGKVARGMVEDVLKSLDLL